MSKGKIALALAAGAILLWYVTRGTATAGTPTVKSSGDVPPRAYLPGTPENAALTRAQDAWYAKHPDGPPFVNDDGSLNILPGFEF